MSDTNRQWLLAARPHGAPTANDFRFEETAVPQAGDGEVLCRTRWLSLDPYMRGLMDDSASYIASVPIGGVMGGGTVGEVLESRAEGFAAGDIVLGMGGWQSHFVLPAGELRKLPPGVAPLSYFLGVLGMPGMTAHTGLMEIGKPQAGETIVIGAASGAVGALVGQIAKIKGLRVVGVAGGPDKCAYVRDELGFDACLDHRAADFEVQLAAACPNGVDIYWENVGGRTLWAVLPLLNDFARVPLCGLIAWYNLDKLPGGPDLSPVLLRTMLVKRLTVRGFIVLDFEPLFGAAFGALSGWLRAGQLKTREDVVEGLENAPEAFIGLLEGRNFGKLVVKVD